MAEVQPAWFDPELVAAEGPVAAYVVEHPDLSAMVPCRPLLGFCGPSVGLVDCHACGHPVDVQDPQPCEVGGLCGPAA